MHHRQRWTLEKIKKRLTLVEPLVYIKRTFLLSFRYQELRVENDSIQLSLRSYQIMTIR
jgi:hypothetical protein